MDWFSRPPPPPPPSPMFNISLEQLILPSAALVCFYLFRNQVMSRVRTFFFGSRGMKQIFCVDSKQQCDEIIQKYFLHHEVLGLDCEWVTIGSHQGPVSLLQLASPDGICALFRLPKLYQYDYFNNMKSIPSSLEELLYNEDILKVGVAIENDAKYLTKDYDVLMTSWLDLRHLAKDNDVLPRGLAYLAQETVGITLEKKFNVRVSNWDAEDLSEEQIQYAALDAFAAVSIFSHFVSLKQSLWSLLFSSRSDSFASYIRDYCAHYREIPFKDKTSFRQGNESTIGLQSPQKRSFSTSTQKDPKDTPKPWKGFRHGKVYDNCYLLDSLGQVLCTCDRKKCQCDTCVVECTEEMNEEEE